MAAAAAQVAEAESAAKQAADRRESRACRGWRSRRTDSLTESLGKSVARSDSAARMGSQIVRGVLGSILGGKAKAVVLGWLEIGLNSRGESRLNNPCKLSMSIGQFRRRSKVWFLRSAEVCRFRRQDTADNHLPVSRGLRLLSGVGMVTPTKSANSGKIVEANGLNRFDLHSHTTPSYQSA